MSLLQRQELSRAQSIELDVIQSVRRRVRSFVEHVCAEKTVIVGKLVIHARGEKVFVDNLLARKSKYSQIAVAPGNGTLVGKMVKSEVRLHRRIDSHRGRCTGATGIGARAQRPTPRRRGGHSSNCCDAL